MRGVAAGLVFGSLLSLPVLPATPIYAAEPAVTLATRVSWTARLVELSAGIDQEPKRVGLYSERGDLYFFLGDFAKSVQDYDRMVELDPQQDASHWRRGIAYFYADDFAKAAGQFERYHSFDQVDRENGIWRYLSQLKAHGQKVAREGLLKYEKDDREPFPDVYRLFAGTIEPAAIVDRIEKASVSDDEREKRRFYAELYIGLNEAVEGRDAEARAHLAKAVANTWGRKAGYGPHYMWQVGRLHLELLEKKAKSGG